MTERHEHGSHDPWTDRLSEHLDGLLSGPEADAVEEHLRGCAPCRAVLADLRAVRDAARGLEDAPPERDLWPGIRDALGARPLTAVDGAADAVRPERPSRVRGLFFTVPQLAAAGLACVLIGGAAVWSLAPGEGGGGSRTVATPATRTPLEQGRPVVQTALGDEIASTYAPEVERLEQLLASSRDRLEPGTIRVLEKNLAIIDLAIDESVGALEVDPGNPWVETHLRRSWERKVSYLRETAELLEWSESDE
ncbi:MAG: zf-HC2 domain-containing protein [Gemmatimonadota bacterium]|jgi:anti-sigma factor RsiW